MTASSPADAPLLATTAPDGRADRGRRDVSVSPNSVTIRRRLQGIDMRLSLAVSAYRGVALCLLPGQDGRLVHQIRLVHRDQDLSVLLDEALDDRDIIADWRLWARVLGRPALVEREIGSYEALSAEPAIDTAALARRKRPSKRRPRFLARRKVACWPAAPANHGGEREIIARD